MGEMLKTTAITVLALAAFLLDPTAAIGGDDVSFKYGAAEMRAAIEGTWVLSIDDPARTKITLKIKQAGKAKPHASRQMSLIATASACNRRTLVRPAGACKDGTDMPLEVSIVDGPSQTVEHANFNVGGMTFDGGALILSLSKTGDFVANISPTGEASPFKLAGEPYQGKLVRISRAN